MSTLTKVIITSWIVILAMGLLSMAAMSIEKYSVGSAHWFWRFLVLVFLNRCIRLRFVDRTDIHFLSEVFTEKLQCNLCDFCFLFIKERS